MRYDLMLNITYVQLQLAIYVETLIKYYSFNLLLLYIVLFIVDY